MSLGTTSAHARQHAAGQPPVPSTESGRAFVALANSYYARPSLPGTDVSRVDLSTGAVLGTTPVGRAPQVLAVDTRSGRVFVVNTGGGTVSVPHGRRANRLQRLPDEQNNGSPEQCCHRHVEESRGPLGTEKPLHAGSGRQPDKTAW